jgi:tetratricopeptide (TPR) repeat protein
MDLDSPVVQLCVKGQEAEALGRIEEALAFYEQAWAARRDDLDACVAAHYVARHQATEPERLSWNLRALEAAEAVGDERVISFYPSLLLNIGRSYEALDDAVMARGYYEQAAIRAAHVPDGPLGVMTKDAIARALERTQAAIAAPPT